MLKSLFVILGVSGALNAYAYAKLITQTPLLSKKALIQEVITNMVFVKGGSYLMGTDNKKYFDLTGDNTHPHKVILSDFYFQKYLVSGTQYNSYLKITKQTKKLKKNFYLFLVNNMPANDNWRAALTYCKWLGKQTGLPFDLPTEAQWEYVARDRGKNIAYPTNNGQFDVGKNYPGRNFFDKLVNGKAFPINNVNEIPVNKLGIHQMGGNVSEWMKDWYDHDYYWRSPVKNPQGPKTYPGTLKQNQEMYGAPMKVTRGTNQGMWFDDSPAQEASTYARDSAPINDSNIGFRCVINSSIPRAKLIKISKDK